MSAYELGVDDLYSACEGNRVGMLAFGRYAPLMLYLAFEPEGVGTRHPDHAAVACLIAAQLVQQTQPSGNGFSSTSERSGNRV